VQKSFKNNQFEIRVVNMSQISDVEEKIQHAVVVISTSHLKEHLEEIISTIQKGKGNINLKLCVVGKNSNDEDFGCDLLFNKRKVNLDVIKYFHEMEGTVVRELR